MDEFLDTYFKVLPNEDHSTCGKEIFIRNPDHRAVTLGFRVKWLS
jgi:hypothetical protein